MAASPADGPTSTRSDTLRGIAHMAFAMSCIGLVDAIAKWLGQSLHGVQVAWGYLAGMLTALLLHLLFTRTPPRLLRSRQPWLQLGRAACLVLSLSCLFVALQYLPLAETTTISFTAPLFIVALAGPLLGERVGWRRWAAVLTGLAGALLVARPGSALFQWPALLPFVGAFLFALFTIITRRLSADRPQTTLLHTFGAGTVLISLAMPWLWQTPTALHWALFALSGMLGALAHLSIVRALGLADASVVAPLNYVRLVWALGLGLLLFGQWPDALALAGGGVIVASGLYVVYGASRGH